MEKGFVRLWLQNASRSIETRTFVALSLLSELGEVDGIFAGLRHLENEAEGKIAAGIRRVWRELTVDGGWGTGEKSVDRTASATVLRASRTRRTRSTMTAGDGDLREGEYGRWCCWVRW